MLDIQLLIKKYNLKVIKDSTQAHGAIYHIDSVLFSYRLHNTNTIKNKNKCVFSQKKQDYLKIKFAQKS